MGRIKNLTKLSTVIVHEASSRKMKLIDFCEKVKCHPTTLSYILTGIRPLTKKFAIAISEYLDGKYTPEELLRFSKERNE